MSDAAKPRRRAALSPVENLLLGAFGGSLETGLQMPLLTWKFSRQEGRPLPTNLTGWYRGVLAQTSSVAPITALQVMSNGILERLITGNKRESTDIEKNHYLLWCWTYFCRNLYPCGSDYYSTTKTCKRNTLYC